MPVEMQVRPHEQDVVNTLEARADIQRILTRLKNVNNCNLTKLYNDKRSPATMKDNLIPRQFWNRIFASETLEKKKVNKPNLYLIESSFSGSFMDIRSEIKYSKKAI